MTHVLLTPIGIAGKQGFAQVSIRHLSRNCFPDISEVKMAFKMPPQAPPNSKHKPASSLASNRALIDHSRKIYDEIVAEVRPEDATFNNVLLPLAEDENHTFALKKLFKIFSCTSASEELRDASNTSDAHVNVFESQTLMREDLFQRIDAVLRMENVDAEFQLYLDQIHQAFLRNGLGIADG
jgi:metallopeptidase MepB